MVRLSTLLNFLSYAAATLGVAPLFLYLDRPVQLALPVAFVAGILFDRRRRYPLRGGLVTLLSLVCFFLYAVQISRDHLIEPVVNMLALLLAVRLVTEKSGRNTLQIFVLAVFALASSSLLTLSIAFFLYLVLLVTGVTVGLVLLSFHAVDPHLVFSRRQSGRILGVALILPAASLVLMLAFFVILPRTQYPLWNFLNPAASATAGFSEEVRPGSVAGIAAVKEVALRVESVQLPRDELYWRGIVLNTPQGSIWIRQAPPAGERASVRGGQVVTQTVYPEPKAGNYLLALDVPRGVEGLNSSQAADFIFRARGSLERRVKYTAVSVIRGDFEASGPVDRDFYLALPPLLSARVRQVAADIAARGAGAGDRIALLENFFTSQQLAYATTDLPAGEDPVDAFLFEKKRGYCEFFASSFALLLRLADVPARLVGGYYGGEYNQTGGYYLVTEDTAHVWVEALVDGRWVRLDPSRLAHNAAASLLAPRGRGLSGGRRLVDTIDYFWNRAVVAYDLGQQLRLLQQTNRQWRQLKVSFDAQKVGGYLLAGLAVATALIALLKRGRRSREERLLRAFLRRLRKKHHLEAIPAATGLQALANQLDDPVCREFAEIFGGGVYRDRKLTEEELKKLRMLVRKLRAGN
jgi:transglutaminase-like putative cysteine protease